MERLSFSILSFVLIGSEGMTQIYHGGSGWAQIDHLGYGHHFKQGTTYCPIQVQAFHLPEVTTKMDGGRLNQAGTQVKVGTVNFYFDYSFHLDESPNKEGQTTTSTVDRGLPAFGWNLESVIIENNFPEFQQSFPLNEVKELNSPIPQVIGVFIDHGDPAITILSPKWQKLVDESMWNAVRGMPENIKVALIQERELHSGKAFEAPLEPSWVWYTEMQGFYSERGTTTKIIGPEGVKLIRITGKKPTEINGIVDAGEEDIYLINPNGITLGPKVMMGESED